MWRLRPQTSRTCRGLSTELPALNSPLPSALSISSSSRLLAGSSPSVSCPEPYQRPLALCLPTVSNPTHGLASHCPAQKSPGHHPTPRFPANRLHPLPFNLLLSWSPRQLGPHKPPSLPSPNGTTLDSLLTSWSPTSATPRRAVPPSPALPLESQPCLNGGLLQFYPHPPPSPV